MKSLIAILGVAIILPFCAVELSAQENKDNKKGEISGYFGAVPNFYASGFGLGLEYFLTHCISLDGEINYLLHRGEGDGMDEQKYRLLWDINLLFYFDLTKVIKKPAINLFLTMGTGYQYDSEEYPLVSITTQEQNKYEYEQFSFQWISFGGGLKVNIKEDWALRLLYKIHRLGGEELQTDRLALGLSYRF